VEDDEHSFIGDFLVAALFGFLAFIAWGETSFQPPIARGVDLQLWWYVLLLSIPGFVFVLAVRPLQRIARAVRAASGKREPAPVAKPPPVWLPILNGAIALAVLGMVAAGELVQTGAVWLVIAYGCLITIAAAAFVRARLSRRLRVRGDRAPLPRGVRLLGGATVAFVLAPIVPAFLAILHVLR
jgi:hypothetical protein